MNIWLRLLCVTVLLWSLTAAARAADPAQVGQWEGPYPWPSVPVHLSVLPNGHVLWWSRGDLETQEGRLDTYEWDPQTGTHTQRSAIMDLFCSGHAFLPDGRLLVTGGLGHISDRVFTYDWRTATWTEQALMAGTRYYPTNVPLSTGEQLVLGGDMDAEDDEGGLANQLPQVWQASGGWRNLPAALKALPLYPWAFQIPDGRVFMFGPDPQPAFLDPTGAGRWAAAPAPALHQERWYGCPVVYGERGDAGQAVVRIAAIGGGHRPSATVEAIKFTPTTRPQWWRPADMPEPRTDATAVTLPQGHVLVVGGTSERGQEGGHTPSYAGAQLSAVKWNPHVNQWKTLAAMQIPRTYHSAAVLLPDGRVLVAGGGKKEGFQDQPNAEVFSPPYLFRGPRPQITSVPEQVGYGQVFSVATTATDIDRVSIVRLPAETHSYNQNQGFAFLAFTPTGGGLLVTAPGNPTAIPPGHYLLFVINTAGVPSEARIVRIG